MKALGSKKAKEINTVRIVLTIYPIVVLLDNYHAARLGKIPRPKVVEANAICHRFRLFVEDVPIGGFSSIGKESRGLMPRLQIPNVVLAPTPKGNP